MQPDCILWCNMLDKSKCFHVVFTIEVISRLFILCFKLEGGYVFGLFLKREKKDTTFHRIMHLRAEPFEVTFALVFFCGHVLFYSGGLGFSVLI